jgi:hypothetical protein
VIVELAANEETYRVAYWAEVAAMLVAEESPSVVAIVKAPATKLALVNAFRPAMAISMYWVRPLLVTSPQVPDSVPVTGRGRSRRVVRLIVIFNP